MFKLIVAVEILFFIVLPIWAVTEFSIKYVH